MALPVLMQKLFEGAGAGPKLLRSILPTATKTEVGAVKLDDVVSTSTQTLTPEQKAQIVKNLEGTFLPLSGGEISGSVTLSSKMVGIDFENSGNYQGAYFGTNLQGKTSYDGAYAVFRPSNSPRGAGEFEIKAGTKVDGHKILSGNVNGSLLWGNREVEVVNDFRTEIAMSDGHHQNYIRFKSGLQIVWGTAQVNGVISSSKWVTYIVPFSQSASVSLSNDANVNLDNSIGVGWQSNTGFAVGANKSTANGIAHWIAVGSWK